MIMVGPTFSDGVRVAPTELVLPRFDIEGKISFEQGGPKDVKMGPNNGGTYNMEFSQRGFGSLLLEARDGLVEEVTFILSKQEDKKRSMVSLMLGGNDVETEREIYEKTAIMFEQEDIDEDSSENTVTDRGVNWDILGVENFEAQDVSGSITQCIGSVEMLLKDIEFSNGKTPIGDIQRSLLEFDTRAQSALSQFNREKF